MAPEIVNNEFYDEKCDVFSFGIIMFELLVETTEPYGRVAFNIEYHVARNPLFRPQIPLALSASLEQNQLWLIEIMSKCWMHNPEDRPSFVDIGNALKQHM